MRRLAVIIATRGRPALVRQTVELLAKQTRPADAIFVIGARAEDVAGFDREEAGLVVTVGREGSSSQRNDGLRLAADAFDYVAFFDDDFVPSRRWLEHAVACFEARSDIAGLTGTLLADGINGGGISFDEATALVAARDASPELSSTLDESFGPYGCNMAFRVSAIRGLEFDERLPFYAWLEDSDFGGQIRRAGGKTARADALWGVHLGNKTGRERGIRLGYSQIANPIYLARKGTLPVPFLLRQMTRNFAANLLKALAPEPHVDRPGRLKGNLVAVRDALLGRLAPERVREL